MIGIYCITHKATDRHYVGQSLNIQKRWCAHISRKETHLGRALSKYGPDAFDFKVLCECLPEELDRLEGEWILKLQTTTLGFNKKTGGFQPRYTEQSCLKMSVSQKARWVTDHTRLAAATRAALRQPAVRAKISKSVQAYHANLTEEQRAVRDAVRVIGIRKVRDKIGASTAERWKDPGMRARMTKSGPVPANRKNDKITLRHVDGRELIATRWEFINEHKILKPAQMTNLISGYRKIAKGWSYVSALTTQEAQA